MALPEYLVVETWLASSLEDGLADLVGDSAALGAHLTPAGAGTLHAAVYFDRERGSDLSAFVAACEDLGGEHITVNVEPAQDWLASYRELARPFSVGRTWWIEPDPGSRTTTPAGRRRLTVEPRMAFGTGSHESTHLVLLELEDDPPAGLRFLDVGAGSGILALAAQRLGAAWVLGLDIDLQAMFVARQIARDQDFPCRVHYMAGPISAIGDSSFQRVACNMVVAHFMPLADQVRRLLDPAGSVTFSGILRAEEADVRRRLEGRGFVIEHARYLGDWLALRARRA